MAKNAKVKYSIGTMSSVIAISIMFLIVDWGRGVGLPLVGKGKD